MLPTVLMITSVKTNHLIRPRYIVRSYVRELPWCTPKSNLTKKNEWSSNHSKKNGNESKCKPSSQNSTHPSAHDTTNCATKPPARQRQQRQHSFGIIAAMDHKKRMIGINGKLPWNIPEDWNHFVKITSGKTLIVGKNSFYDKGKQDISHLDHCKDVIVVSKTMMMKKKSRDIDLLHEKTKANLHFVQSLDEAIHLSSQLIQKYPSTTSTFSSDEEASISTSVKDTIHCWIGGGERIYEEAIRHPLAAELQLTMVQNVKYDPKVFETQVKENQVTFFPAKYRYDHKFEIRDQMELPMMEDTTTNYRCSVHVYRRKRTRVTYEKVEKKCR